MKQSKSELRIENRQLQDAVRIATTALHEILAICDQSKRSPVAREVSAIIRKRQYFIPHYQGFLDANHKPILPEQSVGR